LHLASSSPLGSALIRNIIYYYCRHCLPPASLDVWHFYPMIQFLFSVSDWYAEFWNYRYQISKKWVQVTRLIINTDIRLVVISITRYRSQIRGHNQPCNVVVLRGRMILWKSNSYTNAHRPTCCPLGKQCRTMIITSRTVIWCHLEGSR